ncbi:hypothetical protein FGIG_02839 [Fasciola gigantica]|uniref:Uncharacterized protein n=1 Tax=Fasciola gigantica TaxID=46835 RepID=A0A504Y8A8_FASGI|nr:hypothetical protein FGIG_02839 [Fasciola gigantica]
MVKLKVLEGTLRPNSDNTDEVEYSNEIITCEQAVETDPLVNASSIGVQAIPLFGHSIGVQSPPRILELGWSTRVTAITHSVCRWSTEQSSIVAATRDYVRVRSRIKQTTEPLLIYLARTRLIRNRMCCPHCPRYPFMYLIRCDDQMDGWQWQCSRCAHSRSVRWGSRLLSCRIPLHELIESLYFWCLKSGTDFLIKKRLPELWWSRVRFICLLDICRSQALQPSPPAQLVHSREVRTTKSRYRRPRLPVNAVSTKPVDVRKPAPRRRNRLVASRWKKVHTRNQLAALIQACSHFQNRKR